MQKIIIIFASLYLFFIPTSSYSASGYINCSTTTENSIRLNYDFKGGEDVSLFRGSTRINTWAPSGVDEDKNIQGDIDKIRKKIDDIGEDIRKELESKDTTANFPEIPSSFRFTRELSFGSKGNDVRYMQIIFNADPQTMVTNIGVGSPGQESNIFGNMTKNAVRRFQTKYAAEILHPWNVQSPTGYVGIQTIKKLNRILDGTVKIRAISPEKIASFIVSLNNIRDDINDIRRRAAEQGSAKSEASGSFTDRNISSSTTYTYYLRDGSSTTSPLIDSVSCKTETKETPPDEGQFTDERDGTVYKTVKIGDQLWMAEDLRYNSGCLTSTTTSANLRSGDNCMNQASNYDGLLYQWNTAMNGSVAEKSQGLCPEGWHIPSDNDWKKLESTLGMTKSDVDGSEWRFSGSVGRSLKTSAWGGNNSSGFSALPGGHYNLTGQLLNPGNYGYWWTSTKTSPTGAYHRTLRRDDSSVGRFISHHNGASSVRCIKD